MTTRNNEEKITAYVLNELDKNEREDVERAMASDSSLMDEVNALSKFCGSIRDELQEEPLPGLTEAQKQSLKSKLEQGSIKEAFRFNDLFQWKFVVPTAALCTAVLAFILTVPQMESLKELRPEGKGEMTLPVSPSAPAPKREKAVNAERGQKSDEDKKVAFVQASSDFRELIYGAIDGATLGSGMLEHLLDKMTIDILLHGRVKNYDAGPYGGGGYSPALEFAREIAARRDYLHYLKEYKFNTEAYDRIQKNPFMSSVDDPLSTFSIDVDTASYSNIRRFINQDAMPPKDAVRIEEMINYFSYDYPVPDELPFRVNVEVSQAPWKRTHRLVRIGIKGKDIAWEKRPKSNLVFLIDVSGSMQSPNKLPLLKRSMKLLVEKLGENDRVAIVVYAGTSGLVLPSTFGAEKLKVLGALDRLKASGSTNGEAGIQLAYKIARA